MPPIIEGQKSPVANGHRPARVDDRVLRRDDLERPVEPAVQRQVREEGLHAGGDRREGGAEGGVVDRGDGRVAAGEVVDRPVALDRQLHLDRDQALAARRVAVDEVLRLPLTVGQRGEALADGALDIVLHGGETGLHRVAPVLVDEAQDLALADLRRLRLRVDVADDGDRVAGVGGDQVGDVLAEAPLVEQTDRRDAQALAEHVAGGDVERARHAAADVRPVAVRLAEGDDLAVGEDRPDEPHVGEVGAAGIGVVDGVDVAGMHVALEGAHHVLAGEVQGADVDGDVLVALRGGVALGVVQRAREVAVVDDEGIAGPQDLLAHLVDAGDEGVLQDLEGHRIERGFLGHG
jgi:hypothetical protein